MDNKPTLHWMEKLYIGGKILAGVYVFAWLTPRMYTAYQNNEFHDLSVDAGVIKFNIGEKAGIAAAQKEFEGPIRRLAEIIDQINSSTGGTSLVATAQLESVLGEFGGAHLSLEARKKSLVDLNHTREELALAKAQVIELQSKLKSILELKADSVQPELSTRHPAHESSSKATSVDDEQARREADRKAFEEVYNRLKANNFQLTEPPPGDGIPWDQIPVSQQTRPRQPSVRGETKYLEGVKAR